MTCALKNNKGVIPNKEKRRFHAEGLHKPIAHLNTRVRNDFILVDGICGDPDFEEGGSPLYGGRLYAGLDPVLIDAFSAAQLGYLPSDIPYIGLAEKLGVGQADIGKALVRELNVPEKRVVSFKSRGRAREFEPLIDARNACSSCYASLVLALSLLDTHTRNKIKEPLAIGQGFAGKKGRTGIGRCTAAFDRTLPGCPPSHQAMLEFLKQIV
jgi:uncharacterized protein (DUF362 family)